MEQADRSRRAIEPHRVRYVVPASRLLARCGPRQRGTALASDKARSPACAAPALRWVVCCPVTGARPFSPCVKARTAFAVLWRVRSCWCALACVILARGGSCQVLPAKQSGRFPSGRALVLRIKPGKPPPVLPLRASIPNAFGPTGKLPPDAPARWRLQNQTVTLARSHAPCLCPAPVSGPQNPARQSSQGRKGRACYGRQACHAPCFPRIYITRNSVPWPFGRSLVPRSLPGFGFAHRICVMQNRGALRKARARPAGVVIQPASLLSAPESKSARH